MSKETPNLRYDTARQAGDEDHFEFRALAERFAANVLNLLAGERADGGFVVGLEGRWGSGKSTILNYLRQDLEARLQRDRQFLVQFDPWWSEDDANLVGALLRAILDALPDQDAAGAMGVLGGLAAAVANVPEGVAALLTLFEKTKLAGEVVHAARNAGGDISKMLSASKPVRKLRDEVAVLFRQKGYSFVVIVDDLDRLAPDKAIRVMSAIKSVADLPGIVYVLAYDPLALSNILQSYRPPLGSDYFEKIVNVSIPVPPITNGQMTNFVSELLSPALNAALAAAPDHQRVVVGLLDAPRDAVRLANAVNFWVGTSKLRELYAPDFVVLEAIRLVRPSAYPGLLATNDIWLNSEMRRSLSRLAGEKDPKPEDELVELEATLGLGKTARDKAVRAALSVLFPKAARYLGKAAGYDETLIYSPSNALSISDGGHFFTYFLHRPVPGAPTRGEVEALIDPATSPEARRELVAEISSRPAADVAPLQQLVAFLDGERGRGQIAPDVLIDIVGAVMGPTTVRRRAAGGERLGSDREVVRGFLGRSVKSLGQLSDAQVDVLIRPDIDLDMLGAAFLVLSAGTVHYLLEGPRETPLVKVSDEALTMLAERLVDAVVAAIGSQDIFEAETAPHLLHMAYKYKPDSVVAAFVKVFEDDRQIVALVDAYRGYTDPLENLALFGSAEPADMKARVLAAYAAIRPGQQLGWDWVDN